MFIFTYKLIVNLIIANRRVGAKVIKKYNNLLGEFRLISIEISTYFYNPKTFSLLHLVSKFEEADFIRKLRIFFLFA